MNKIIKSKFVTIIVFIIIFMIVESIGAYISQSTALYTDVAHLFSDLLSSSFSLVSIHLSRKPASKKYSYGLIKIQALGAVISIMIIYFMVYEIIQMACFQIYDFIKGKPITIEPKILLITSIVGLVADLILMKILHHSGHNHDTAKPNTE